LGPSLPTGLWWSILGSFVAHWSAVAHPGVLRCPLVCSGPSCVLSSLPICPCWSILGSFVAYWPVGPILGFFVAHWSVMAHPVFVRSHVSVVDRDSAANGHVNCSVNHPSVFALQQKYATEFQLVTAVALDRERTEHYALKIRCQDGGGGRGQRASRVTEKSLQVRVTDVNDNAPVFSKQTYRGSIIENSFIGASVLQVRATKTITRNFYFRNGVYFRVSSVFFLPFLSPLFLSFPLFFPPKSGP